MKNLHTKHGVLKLPAFLPDATRSVVRSVDSQDLKRCGVQGLVINTYHLMLKPGAKLVRQMGGCHAFMNWDMSILSDSGGFQIFSLIRQNPKLGTIRENKVIFKLSDGKKKILTPEKSIQMQFYLGSDIMMCLDYCTHPEDTSEIQLESVKRTISWAKLCKKEYDKYISQNLKNEQRALIFAIIQGGNDKKLRKLCADSLKSIGFDGYGFGGWPIDSKGNLLEDILGYTAEIMPADLPKYALGVGKPENIVTCVRMGYNLLDCVVPTRDARHQRLYVFNADDLESVDLSRDDFYRCLYIQDKEHIKDSNPVSSLCDCLCCKNYSRAYLHYLFKIKDTLAYRLATIHNLRFYMNLMEIISKNRRIMGR
jgi:queuine tRNA-ribosyltransferase